MTRAAAALALSVAAGIVVTAQTTPAREFGRAEAAWCGDAGDVDVCEVREATLPNSSTIAIDGRPNGGVHLRAWDRNDVRVRVRVTAVARTDEAARALAGDVKLIAAGGRIALDGPDRRSMGNSREWWSGSFEVEAPRKAHVTIDVTNGGIVVEGLEGTLDAHATNGGLVFSDVAGDVRGETTNGGVTIDLAGSRWQGAGLDVRTTNGGVRVSLPADYSADLDARSTNGGIAVDFPMTISRAVDLRQSVRATIGSGGPLLRLVTTNGGVRVTRK